MTDENLLTNGSYVKILNSGFHRARIAGYLGPFGPNGARIYRIMVMKKPRMYVQVRQDQLELLEDQGKAKPAAPETQHANMT